MAGAGATSLARKRRRDGNGTDPAAERSADATARWERLLGAALLRGGVVTEQQLAEALRLRREKETSLDVSLHTLGFASDREIRQALSRIHDVPVVRLDDREIEESVLDLVPATFARRHLTLPIARTDQTLTVAMVAPEDLDLIDDLKFMTGCDIEPVVAARYALERRIGAEYEGEDGEITDLLEELAEEEVEWVQEEDRKEEDLTAREVQARVEDEPVVRLVNWLLSDAVRREASDIHIEPYEEELRIRYRIDGVLRDVLHPPKRLTAALVSRIKILADLDIAERRRPQDGRIKMRMEDRLIVFRVSALPMSAGEKIVLRVLDKSNLRLSLEDFGMAPGARRDFERAIQRPHGMVLVTGPTGSGKTTTLYASMSRRNDSEVNIMTAEDPIEYQLRGINQLQIKPDIGLDFAAALRSFLRQDPDIIMLGEIRDRETAEIAIKAALTGHLVLSTLHTNDAANTATRLLDMGVEPFNLASAVECITAQRLVRKICDECRAETSYTRAELDAAGVPQELREEITFYAGEGCTACGETGYQGRQGLFEVLPVDGELREMILNGASADEIRERATDQGMLTLRQDGLRKVEQGLTTLEEVLRETGGFTLSPP